MEHILSKLFIHKLMTYSQRQSRGRGEWQSRLQPKFATSTSK
jgi:hypothetical protein